MIVIDLSGLAQFKRDCEKMLRQFDADINLRFQGFTHETFQMLAENSPQWSSNLASNWTYGVGAPDTSYTEVPEKFGSATRNFSPRLRGDATGVYRSMAKLKASKLPTWRDTVYISNFTPDDAGGFLAENMENGEISLRPGNLVSGQVALFRYTVAVQENKTL